MKQTSAEQFHPVTAEPGDDETKGLLPLRKAAFTLNSFIADRHGIHIFFHFRNNAGPLRGLLVKRLVSQTRSE